MKLPLEIVVGSNYIKYDKLSQIIYYAYAGSEATELNIFIDLYSVLKPLFSSNADTQFEMSSDVELSASIFNMCAHYRQFFRNMGVNTNFFLIFGLNCPSDNQILCPGYNNKFMDAWVSKNTIRNMILENLNLISVLSQALPGIYYFDIGDKEVSGFIEFLLEKFHFNNKMEYPFTENLVITKDILPLQLVSSGCNILRPKKSQGTDNSFMINHNNFWTAFMVEMRNVNTPVQYQIDTGYFSNILAMTRVPERCMSSIKSLPAAYSVVSKLIQDHTLIANGDYTQSTLNRVLDMTGFKTNFTTLEMRWKALSTKFAARFIIPNNPALSNAQLINIQDPDGVREIVSKYYAKSPIDLDRL